MYVPGLNDNFAPAQYGYHGYKKPHTLAIYLLIKKYISKTRLK